MDYVPKIPRMACPCGIRIALDQGDLIDPDTGEYEGAIWQHECDCGRSYTLEIAFDPSYPGAPPRNRSSKVSTTCITCGRARIELHDTYVGLTELVDKALDREALPPCNACGKVPARCTLCDDEARYFLTVEAEGRATDIHLCDTHSQPYSDAEGSMPIGSELGIYWPNSDCSACDSWR